MWLKVIIVVLFVALVVSLFTGLAFLFQDREQEGKSRRLWNSLTVRLALTALLVGFLIYGVFTGQLGSNAPWDARHQTEATNPK
ncbi:MAG: DUF2909 domain-containing protein [Oceanicoccus sp.]